MIYKFSGFEVGRDFSFCEDEYTGLVVFNVTFKWDIVWEFLAPLQFQAKTFTILFLLGHWNEEELVIHELFQGFLFHRSALD
ncbi:hypothetical protein Leryth_020046 [Lithospermum erythrorhizon]|nr:hypothetical protein Leryth_020046 [Lithospermum erythrorhizon]